MVNILYSQAPTALEALPELDDEDFDQLPTLPPNTASTQSQSPPSSPPLLSYQPLQERSSSSSSDISDEGRDYDRFKVPKGPYSPSRTSPGTGTDTGPIRSILKPLRSFMKRCRSHNKSVTVSAPHIPRKLTKLPKSRQSPDAQREQSPLLKKEDDKDEEEEEEEEEEQDLLQPRIYQLEMNDKAGRKRGYGHSFQDAELVRMPKVPQDEFSVVVNAPASWTLPRTAALWDSCDLEEMVKRRMRNAVRRDRALWKPLMLQEASDRVIEYVNAALRGLEGTQTAAAKAAISAALEQLDNTPEP